MQTSQLRSWKRSSKPSHVDVDWPSSPLDTDVPTLNKIENDREKSQINTSVMNGNHVMKRWVSSLTDCISHSQLQTERSMTFS